MSVHYFVVWRPPCMLAFGPTGIRLFNKEGWSWGRWGSIVTIWWEVGTLGSGDHGIKWGGGVGGGGGKLLSRGLGKRVSESRDDDQGLHCWDCTAGTTRHSALLGLQGPGPLCLAPHPDLCA